MLSMQATYTALSPKTIPFKHDKDTIIAGRNCVHKTFIGKSITTAWDSSSTGLGNIFPFSKD